MRALLDTGASITVISRVYADHCKLFQTNEGSEITAIGAGYVDRHPSMASGRLVSNSPNVSPCVATPVGQELLRNIHPLQPRALPL